MGLLSRPTVLLLRRAISQRVRDTVVRYGPCHIEKNEKADQYFRLPVMPHFRTVSLGVLNFSHEKWAVPLSCGLFPSRTESKFLPSFAEIPVRGFESLD